MPRTRACLLLAISLIFLSTYADAQSSLQQARLRLQRITSPAGYIFAGKVKSVSYLQPRSLSEVATVQITFQVEQAVKGTRVGSFLTVQEWAGLWNAGERYRVGERVVLFLYPKSKLGLTSAVGGAQGRFALDREGQVILDQQRVLTVGALGKPVRATARRIPLRQFRREIRLAQEQED